MTAPTPKQATRLSVLADGYAVLAPKRGEWVGLLRKGWVERDRPDDTARGGLLPPALAIKETECSETTSAKTSRSVVASGGPLRSLPSLGFHNTETDPAPDAARAA